MNFFSISLQFIKILEKQATINYQQQYIQTSPIIIKYKKMQATRTQKQLGNQQYKLTNYSQAIEHYRLYTAQQHVDNIQAMLNIALCYFKLEQYHNAIAECDQIISQDQTNFKCYYRRTMCRKEIIAKSNSNNGLQEVSELLLQKYKLYYDCKMFCQHCSQPDFEKQKQELDLLGRTQKQQLLVCPMYKLDPFLRNLLEIEKDSINSLALSWLEDKHSKKRQATQQDIRHKINNLYKEMTAVKKQKNNQQENKAIIQHISSKIKQLRKKIVKQAKKQQNVLVRQQNEKDSKNQSDKNIDNQTRINIKIQNKIQSKLQNNLNIGSNVQSESQLKMQNISKIQKKQQAQPQSRQVQQQNQSQVQHQHQVESLSSCSPCTKSDTEPHSATQPSSQQCSPATSVLLNKNVQLNIEIPTMPSQPISPATTQSVASNSSSTVLVNLQNMSAKQLYQVYFKQHLDKSRDIFEQFGISIITILTSNIQLKLKEQVLSLVSKQFNKFKFTVKNISKSAKQCIKELLATNNISQQLANLYISK